MIAKFGYKIVNGQCIIDQKEATEIQSIVQKYLSGIPLKEIADELTERKVEYLPGKLLWNRNRIYRILTDKTYLGDSEHKAILGQETFGNIQKLMWEKNTQKNCDRTKVFSPAIIPITCGECGHSVVRRRDKRWKSSVHYICTNPECKISYHISDDELQILIKKLLVDVNEDPPKLPDEKILELKRLNNEIERDLQSANINSDILKSKIFECAALQYSTLYLKPKESMDLTDINPCSQIFIQELKRKVSAIILDGNKKIRLHLVNGNVKGGM